MLFFPLKSLPALVLLLLFSNASPLECSVYGCLACVIAGEHVYQFHRSSLYHIPLFKYVSMNPLTENVNGNMQ